MPLVLHSQVPWDSVWQRPQELAVGLARHRPVIFFGPVQLHELATRFHDRWQPVRTLERGALTVLSPVEFSGEYRTERVREWNRRVRLRALRSYVRPGRFLYLSNQVFDTTIVRRLRPAAVAVDLIDDFAAFNWAPPGARGTERFLLETAALRTAGTGSLQRRWAGAFPDIEYLPSGVAFHRLTAPAAEAPELRALPRPRILYIGSLNDRMNPGLFLEAARVNPNGSVVVVGPLTASFQLGAPAPTNLHFLGLKPHDALPGFYQHCDLGIMPFADNPAARAINPIKALEFLACGMPVLSTPIPDVIAYYPPHIRVEEPGAWPRALAEMLAAPDNAATRAARVEFARDRSWERLVDAFAGRLAALERAAVR